MKSRFTLTVVFLFFSTWSSIEAQERLKSNEAFVPEPNISINSSSFQSYQLIKKGLKGERFSIPKDWRLVSVVSNNKGNDSNEFVLFFQDSKYAVHSIGLQNNGVISGNNLIYIPTTE